MATTKLLIVAALLARATCTYDNRDDDDNVRYRVVSSPQQWAPEPARFLDLDGDGAPDYATANWWMLARERDGAPMWEAQPATGELEALPGPMIAVVLRDADGDGRPDEVSRHDEASRILDVAEE